MGVGAGARQQGRGWHRPRETIADVEQYGIAKLLDELVADLKDGSYRPLAARRVFIPKPGSPTEQRPLSIPAVRDRIVPSRGEDGD